MIHEPRRDGAAKPEAVNRRTAQMSPETRGATIIKMARELVALAAADLTVTGCTLILPDGSTHHFTVAQAMQLIGAAPAAGGA
jgi:hypothetical protein